MVKGLRNSRSVLAIVLIAAVVGFHTTGCATTQFAAYRDPEHASASFRKVAVFLLGTPLNAAATAERMVCDKLAPVSCLVGQTILPPILAYSDDEILKYLKRSGADSVLVAVLASDRASLQYLGTAVNTTGSSHTTGQVNLPGAFRASTLGTTRTVATPMYMSRRVAFGRLALFDMATGALVWGGEMQIEGSGAMGGSDAEFIRSATSKVANELKAAGLVR
jgi:hypothetical protein